MEGPQEREAPAAALAAVLKHSSALPFETAQVRGYDFNRGVDYRALLEAFSTTGFQATNFGRAVHRAGRETRRSEAGGGALAQPPLTGAGSAAAAALSGRALPEPGLACAAAPRRR